jgi:myo-inositol-1(or 4)-monophosphatase
MQSDRVSELLPALGDLRTLVVSVAEGNSDLRSGGAKYVRKLDGSYVTQIDHDLQESLLRVLSERWPDYGAIGEEMTHAEQVYECRNSRNGYWVIDPLDGTTNFTAGFPCYGVSVALVIEGRSRLAVIYDPVREECFSAGLGQGAWLNGEPIRCMDTDNLGACIANVDYKRLVGALASRLVQSPPYRSQRNLGSSVLEWCWLASGRTQLYLHGGQKLWDFAAGYLILTEAGGAATTLSGGDLDCGSLKKRSVVAAASPELLSQWSAWLNINRFDAESTM